MNNYILEDLIEKAKIIEPVRNARIVAGLVKRGRLIISAPNLFKSHPMQKRWGKNSQAIYLHAEINVLRHAASFITDYYNYSIYIARVKANGEWGLAKPCSGCILAIKSHYISDIIYTTNTTGVYNIETQSSLSK